MTHNLWKRYPEYRHSGVDWLGEIPTHWNPMRLKFVAPTMDARLETKPEEVPYVGLEHIQSGLGRYHLDESLQDVQSTVSAFHQGDVLFGKLRPYLAKVIHPDFCGVCTTELLVLRPSSSAEGRYVFYQLLSHGFVETVNSLTYGAKMPRAGPDQVAGMRVAVPSGPEQRAIADFLDRETTRIDALIAKKERLIELLQEKRTALIGQAVTKGLDPNVPMKDSGIEWLGQTPAHWSLTKVKRLFRVVNGSTPATGVAEYWDGDTVWVTPDDLGQLTSDTITHGRRNISQLGHASCATTLVPPGSLVLSTRAPIGHLAIAGVQLCTNQGCKCLLPREVGNVRYFYYQLLAARPHLKSCGDGSTFQELSSRKLESVSLGCPPRREQDAIAHFLDRETARIDAPVSKVHQAIDRLREYRTALISAAVTGKIDVREAAR